MYTPFHLSTFPSDENVRIIQLDLIDIESALCMLKNNSRSSAYLRYAPQPLRSRGTLYFRNGKMRTSATSSPNSASFAWISPAWRLSGVDARDPLDRRGSFSFSALGEQRR